YPIWQLVASVISIILIMIFLSKTAGYNSKRKKFNKKAEKLDTVYAGVFLGMAMTAWTAIACVLMGLAVVSFIIMIIAKKRCNNAEEDYEERFEEYQRNKADFAEQKRQEEYARREEEARRRDEETRKRDDDMKMMFMSMFGGAQGANMSGNGGVQGDGYVGGGYGIGAEQIRGIVSETMTAMLPGVQQMLPQQASVNDELVEKLLEKSEKSEEAMLKIMEKSQKNEEEMRELLKKLTEQPERVVEREVASSTVNDETLKQMMRNQEILMEKILELSSNQSQPQIIEKVVEVPVEVEKIVEKEVVKEVPVEVVKEVKVEVPVKAVAKPKKEVAPRLTLDEAYALLTKEQKKYFDGLKEYVLTKYKCKEKKSTYFVVYGQTTTNPLLKLTVKKDTTVALLKMEDEYMKDLRRDATGDGTKVKVKETEVLVSDAQAFDTAKKMVDLRYDQIERYQDLLREQRAMKK
ncbi:MAG: hypothetical protein K2I46_04185, partial [Clostridia bacterium]|nr:hypothetical protein [Clostridia bacterium]